MTAILLDYYSSTQFFQTVLKNDVKRQKLDGFWIKILELSYLTFSCFSATHGNSLFIFWDTSLHVTLLLFPTYL